MGIIDSARLKSPSPETNGDSTQKQMWSGVGDYMGWTCPDYSMGWALEPATLLPALS